MAGVEAPTDRAQNRWASRAATVSCKPVGRVRPELHRWPLLMPSYHSNRINSKVGKLRRWGGGGGRAAEREREREGFMAYCTKMCKKCTLHYFENGKHTDTHTHTIVKSILLIFNYVFKWVLLKCFLLFLSSTML